MELYDVILKGKHGKTKSRMRTSERRLVCRN